MKGQTPSSTKPHVHCMNMRCYSHERPLRRKRSTSGGREIAGGRWRLGEREIQVPTSIVHVRRAYAQDMYEFTPML